MTNHTNLSIGEAARWLGVAPRTVYRLVQGGRLPGFKVGRQWRFNQEMLEAWIEDRVMAERLKAEAGKQVVRRQGDGEMG